MIDSFIIPLIFFKQKCLKSSCFSFSNVSVCCLFCFVLLLMDISRFQSIDWSVKPRHLKSLPLSSLSLIDSISVKEQEMAAAGNSRELLLTAWFWNQSFLLQLQFDQIWSLLSLNVFGGCFAPPLCIERSFMYGLADGSHTGSYKLSYGKLIICIWLNVI